MSGGGGRAVEVADGIYAIEVEFLGNAGAISAYLVAGNDGVTLIETGPSTVAENLIAGVRDAGYRMEDVTGVIVTHIHLDHAGGAGNLVREHPHLNVWVHPAGAPHLIDNEKLVKSATRIYGEDMGRLWGEIENVPEGNVAVVEDRTPIEIGGRKIVPYFTPGHASHHLALLDEQTGSLFTGDVAGARMQGTALVVPPMPPPDIDIDAWRRSIGLMLELAPERLLLTHSGPFTDVERHLASLRDNIDRFMETGRSVLVREGTDAELTSRLEAWIREELGEDFGRVAAPLDAANPIFMTSMGIRRVLRKSGELER